MLALISTLVKFSRPHTIVHTTLAPTIISRVILRYVDQDATNHYWDVLPIAIAFILINVFIVGINQIYDIPMDKINKPYLPLASGELSVESAWKILTVVLVVSVWAISYATSPVVFGLWLYVLVVGTMYSLPMIRLKKQWLSVAIAITTCRGLVFPLCLAVHLADKVGVAALDVPAVRYILIFSTLWALNISIFKDLPDTLGDSAEAIATLPIKFGLTAVFRGCLAIMVAAWASSSIEFIKSMSGTASISTMVLHAAVRVAQLAVLASNTCLMQIDKPNLAGLTAFYTKIVWGFMYLEWVFLPLWF
ncbi:hypothetical protein H310_11736 [Aphanomyces invadans]|uniref:Homogentisate phytyltransferase n=1 Tax=Aphanomyces invadans TaxID=157072 RepID=A0A024TKV7_9STRA|nr:hypothetical protein H310_11736 [Aphanomyces invadans]ETV94780.1 hypothetical protein H310_11736 [Aphanomyces invadans]|eukprot:XP_008876725.1 hypothetical protein H310_11736 [Aphanomyces invadans]